MFPSKYFAPRYFAPRYWPPVGEVALENLAISRVIDLELVKQLNFSCKIKRGLSIPITVVPATNLTQEFSLKLLRNKPFVFKLNDFRFFN
jgi:hypothetical protein